MTFHNVINTYEHLMLGEHINIVCEIVYYLPGATIGLKSH